VKWVWKCGEKMDFEKLRTGPRKRDPSVREIVEEVLRSHAARERRQF